MAASQSVRVFCFWAIALLLGFSSGRADDHVVEPAAAGRVLELTDDNFETEIAKHDHILVDFYAPWCGFCNRLSPQLDIAAPVLVQGSRPIFLAKIDVEKHSKVGSKYKISAFPTLKYFIKGLPTDYTGPRKADGIITHLRRLSAPSIEQLNSEAELHGFVKSIGTEIPLFIGFGLKATDLEEFANKYRSKAWFAVMETFSEEIMEDFNFDKGPALVVTRGEHGEKTTFYGPFEAEDVTEFVLLNLLPLVSHMTPETLRSVREDGRPVVVAVLESESAPEDKEFIKKLKMAAPAYRKFVFAYVVAPQWPEFLRPFWIRKETKLPTVFVWTDDTFVVSVCSTLAVDLVGYRVG
uniref:Thioredoxin domain-containing protein n=1 Tax=Physcomitrium patens TaxID=3218 RepID=A0A7I4FNM7_PHYPA|nr:protein disulfide isomerase-like 5-2 isoform X2 [Physcomitrium patens]|eukprot:XP_024372669.1 protein disulfide isomerase-like 5-2 isoform X2 [Physcomitrella patens]